MEEKRAEYDMKATGKNLKYCREKMQLSVEQVRRYMCLSSVQAVYKWERGESFPALDNFMALLELYRASPLDVLVKKEVICQKEEKPFFYIECHEKKTAYRCWCR